MSAPPGRFGSQDLWAGLALALVGVAALVLFKASAAIRAAKA